MREILFRGKRTDNGEWVYGWITTQYRKHSDGELLSRMQSNTFGVGEHLVDTNTVGQYTGLTDKNGRKIFEGDIFCFDDEVWSSCYTSCGTEYDCYDVQNYGVIGFDCERACFDFVKYKFNENSVESDLHENNDIAFCDFICKLEVIGNIHDNPELLKGDAE